MPILPPILTTTGDALNKDALVLDQPYSYHQDEPSAKVLMLNRVPVELSSHRMALYRDDMGNTN